MSRIKTIRCFLTDFLVKTGQDNTKKLNYHFLTYKIYKNVVFLDKILKFYTNVEQDVSKLRAKFQVNITTNDKVTASQ